MPEVVTTGARTFFGVPAAADLAAVTAQVVFLGVPYDGGTLNRVTGPGRSSAPPLRDRRHGSSSPIANAPVTPSPQRSRTMRLELDRVLRAEALKRDQRDDEEARHGPREVGDTPEDRGDDSTADLAEKRFDEADQATHHQLIAASGTVNCAVMSAWRRPRR